MKTLTKVNYPKLKVVNNTTGEIISAVTTVKCSSVDEFMMCFLTSISQIVRLDGNTIRVLMWCWKFSSFNPNLPEANIIHNDQTFKQKIRQAGRDLSDSVIDKAMHLLCKKDFLKRQCKGCYYLNPQYFFRGTLTNRAKLQYNILYQPEN